MVPPLHSKPSPPLLPSLPPPPSKCSQGRHPWISLNYIYAKFHTGSLGFSTHQPINQAKTKSSGESIKGLQSKIYAHCTALSHSSPPSRVSPNPLHTFPVEQLAPLLCPREAFLKQLYFIMSIYFHICFSTRLQGRSCTLFISESLVSSIFQYLLAITY